MIVVDTFAFLAQLFRNAPCDQYVDIKMFSANKSELLALRSLRLDSGDFNYNVGQFLVRNWPKPSLLLFGINPRRYQGGMNDASVAIVVCLVFDIDGKRLPLEEQKRRLALVAEHVAIFAIVESGTPGHVHAYFRLIPTAEVERSRHLGKRVRRWLGADATEFPCRPMRLPGGASWKTGQPVAVIPWIEPRAVATLDEFEAALDAAGVPHLDEQERERLTSSFRIDPSDATTLDQAQLQRLWDLLPLRAKDLINAGWQPGGRYDSSSEADAAALRHLYNVGATQAEARYFFLATPNGIGAGLYRRGVHGGYFERTWKFISGARRA